MYAKHVRVVFRVHCDACVGSALLGSHELRIARQHVGDEVVLIFFRAYGALNRGE